MQLKEVSTVINFMVWHLDILALIVIIFTLNQQVCLMLALTVLLICVSVCFQIIHTFLVIDATATAKHVSQAPVTIHELKQLGKKKHFP